MEKIKKFLKDPVVREALDWIAHIGIAVVIAILIVSYVIQITIVMGSSMEKCLHDGDRLIVEKFVYKFKGLNRGDIVVINNPRETKGENTPVIKRIAGLEGDLIEIKDGSVYVNNEKLVEPQINGTYTYADGDDVLGNKKVVVPEGHIYVLGDNREPYASMDSRVYGPVNLKKVEGRAVFRFWPFKSFGKLKLQES